MRTIGATDTGEDVSAGLLDEVAACQRKLMGGSDIARISIDFIPGLREDEAKLPRVSLQSAKVSESMRVTAPLGDGPIEGPWPRRPIT